MLSITTVEGQSLLDVAVQCYGNIDGVFRIIQDNDLVGKLIQPGSAASDEVDLCSTVVAGTVIYFDDTAEEYNAVQLAKLAEEFGERPVIIVTGLKAEDFKIHSSVYSAAYA